MASIVATTGYKALGVAADQGIADRIHPLAARARWGQPASRMNAVAPGFVETR